MNKHNGRTDGQTDRRTDGRTIEKQCFGRVLLAEALKSNKKLQPTWCSAGNFKIKFMHCDLLIISLTVFIKSTPKVWGHFTTLLYIFMCTICWLRAVELWAFNCASCANINTLHECL